MPELTIGMATYKDFDGLYFTIQSLRMYQDVADTEFVVIDNYGCDDSKRFVQSVPGAKYIRATEEVGTSAPRNRVFTEATGTYVVCCDSHVLFEKGAIAALRAYYRAHPDTRDLIQGPLVYDDLRNVSTHFEPIWRGQMWGTWGTDPRGTDPKGEVFDIPSQGLGVFSCRRDAWLGFNPRFRGFGGEEGYIHEKFRQSGARSLCLPALRWVHRFGRPNGVPYPLTVNDKFRNYIIGHSELGLDLAPAIEHFTDHLPEVQIQAVLREILGTDQYVNPVQVDGISLAGFSPAPPPPPATPAPKPAVSHRPAAPMPPDGRPLVSCICATWNRAPEFQHLIEEAIESFLRQDYPNKELVILNDTPGQELVSNAPGVRIINAPQRYPSLGAKLNAAIEAARGDLIAIWDDDDISLPWRLSNSVDHLGNADYFNPGNYWFKDSSGLQSEHGMGYAFNASLFRRSAFETAGGFPNTAGDSYRVDALMDGRLRRADIRIATSLNGRADLAEWSYILRWGVSPTHISGIGHEGAWDQIGAMNVQSGRFVLTPGWREDYTEMIAPLVPPTTPRPTPPPASGGGPGRGGAGFGSLFGKSASARQPADRPRGRGGGQQAYAGDLPLVSCICPTYNRAPNLLYLIEEAIESFLRQDYPNKELVILNDTPGQELACDAPGVRIINAPERYPSLGEKRNALVAAAHGDLIAMWDDDDISLPNRLSLSVERLGDFEYFDAGAYWFFDKASFPETDGLTCDHGYGLALPTCIYTRAGFEAAGGYQPINLGDDLKLYEAFKARQTVAPPFRREKDLDKWYYIYRWGVSPVHMSGLMQESFYVTIGTRPITPGRFVLNPHWQQDYFAGTRKIIAARKESQPSAAPTPTSAPAVISRSSSPSTGRRAIVAFVDDHRHLLQQAHALRLSWKEAEADDTDLVLMGPATVLATFPDDVVKVPQQPAAALPVWKDYHYINSIASLNDVGADGLDNYDYVLRTDVDTFITPAWNNFRPAGFVTGHGAYSNSEEIRQNLRNLAADYGLRHHGITSIGSTWYGPTAQVRRACAISEMLTRHLVTNDFLHTEGAWPGWYRGVSTLYAGEIAINHCVEEFEVSRMIDTYSTTNIPITDVPHIHCWHTDTMFSKHWFMSRRYDESMLAEWPADQVPGYCLKLSFESLRLLKEQGYPIE